MQVFRYSYEMYSPDLTPASTLRLTSLMGYLQDISTRHYRAVTHEVDSPLLWVIVGWDVRLHKDVVGLQKLVIETTPVYFRRFLAVRSYRVYDERGDLVAEGQSKWAVLHRDTHQPHPVPEEMYTLFDVDPKAPIPRLDTPEAGEEQEQSRTPYRVLAQDIDVNQHVNNIAYLRWALDLITTEEQRALPLRQVLISYKKEGMEGDDLVLLSAKKARSLQVTVQNRAGEALALVELRG